MRQCFSISQADSQVGCDVVPGGPAGYGNLNEGVHTLGYRHELRNGLDVGAEPQNVSANDRRADADEVMRSERTEASQPAPTD